MKRSFVAAALLVLVSAQMAAAQMPAAKPNPKAQVPDHPISMGPLTPTPEIWFYEQALRAYNDPKTAVRHKAEADAAARRDRIAAQSWYGMSKSRPTANPVPHMSGIYSPAFMGNSRTPNYWTAPSSVVVVPHTTY